MSLWIVELARADVRSCRSGGASTGTSAIRLAAARSTFGGA